MTTARCSECTGKDTSAVACSKHGINRRTWFQRTNCFRTHLIFNETTIKNNLHLNTVHVFTHKHTICASCFPVMSDAGSGSGTESETKDDHGRKRKADEPPEEARPAKRACLPTMKCPHFKCDWKASGEVIFKHLWDGDCHVEMSFDTGEDCKADEYMELAWFNPFEFTESKENTCFGLSQLSSGTSRFLVWYVVIGGRFYASILAPSADAARGLTCHLELSDQDEKQSYEASVPVLSIDQIEGDVTKLACLSLPFDVVKTLADASGSVSLWGSID